MKDFRKNSQRLKTAFQIEEPANCPEQWMKIDPALNTSAGNFRATEDPGDLTNFWEKDQVHTKEQELEWHWTFQQYWKLQDRRMIPLKFFKF